MVDSELTCRLCGFGAPVFLCRDKRRPFYLCGHCELVFVPQQYWLDAHDERARYALHDNSVSNTGYVKYLLEMADAVMADCRPGIKVLDFGSGENAVLCQLLGDKGIDIYAYDPLYGRSLSVANGDSDGYDIIIMCEVIEHIRDIKSELALIGRLLRKNGIVYIRTQIYEDILIFPNWWYAQDSTHINFFSWKSLRATAAMTGRQIGSTGYPDIFVLRYSH